MASDLVSELEHLFLPRLQAASDNFAKAFPTLQFKVWSSSVGGLTDYQGHNLGVECLFPDAPEDQADSVAIIIGVKHLTTTPMLCDASVDWGHGWHPDVTIDLLPNPVAYSPSALNELSMRFEQLLEVFRIAVQAGPGRVGA